MAIKGYSTHKRGNGPAHDGQSVSRMVVDQDLRNGLDGIQLIAVNSGIVAGPVIVANVFRAQCSDPCCDPVRSALFYARPEPSCDAGPAPSQE